MQTEKEILASRILFDYFCSSYLRQIEDKQNEQSTPESKIRCVSRPAL